MARRIALLASKTWRTAWRTAHVVALAHAAHVGRRITDRRTGIDGRRTASHLSWWSAVVAWVRMRGGTITGTSGRGVVGSVARRTIHVYVETAGRGRDADGRRVPWERGSMLMVLAGRCAGRSYAVGGLDAGG